MHSFGASAPAGELLKKFGFTPDKVLERRTQPGETQQRGLVMDTQQPTDWQRPQAA